jgi:hypothetical protein
MLQVHMCTGNMYCTEWIRRESLDVIYTKEQECIVYFCEGKR